MNHYSTARGVSCIVVIRPSLISLHKSYRWLNPRSGLLGLSHNVRSDVGKGTGLKANDQVNCTYLMVNKTRELPPIMLAAHSVSVIDWLN